MFHIFIVCSGLAALINLGVGYLLYGAAGLNGPLGYPLSIAIAFVSGMGVSFVLNRRFTYPESGRLHRHELRDFLVVSLVGLLLTTGIARLLHWGARDVLLELSPTGVLPETKAHIAAVAITAIYSFLAHKYISFRRAGTPTPHAAVQMAVGQKSA